MLELSKEICFRLIDKKLRAGGVSVNIRNNELSNEQFQMKFTTPEQSSINIAKYAFELFKERYNWDKPIRTVTISAIYLTDEDIPIQLSIFEDNSFKEKLEKAEKCVQDLNIKYGSEIVKSATLISNENLPNSRRRIDYEKHKK